MDAEFEYIDHSIKVKEALSEIAYRAIEESAGIIESQVKQNTVVDTGQTKNSWTHNISASTMAGEYRATIGSPLQNAIWEEFGTGEYALNGDGRKGGWSYQDERGDWHHTMGKHPRRPFWKTYVAKKNTVIRHIQNAFKGGIR